MQLIHTRPVYKNVLWGILNLGLTLPLAVAADNLGADSAAGPTLKNPISANNFTDLLVALLSIVVQVAIPVATVFIIYSGFLFVSAGGEEKKLTAAKDTLFWTVIGTAIILGAKIIVTVVSGTIKQVGV